MKRIFLTMMAGSLLMLSSCTKSQGPQGYSGPQGQAGLNGNANVIGENPVTVNAGTWSFGSNVYSATFTDANITSSVVANGLVEVYKQYPDGSWTNLPDINGRVSTVYNFYTNGFVISVLTTDGTVTPNPLTVTFRVVVVPSNLRKAHPGTNWKNYSEAMAAINASVTL